jgi:hypothetical protein
MVRALRLGRQAAGMALLLTCGSWQRPALELGRLIFLALGEHDLRMAPNNHERRPAAALG